MSLSDLARQWWARRSYERDTGKIPDVDLRASKYGRDAARAAGDWVPTYPAKTSPSESEAKGAEGIPDIPLTVWPTPSINPYSTYPAPYSNAMPPAGTTGRPRTIAGGYDADRQILRLKFRPGASSKSPGGAIYDYYNVSLPEFTAIRDKIINSTGRYINDELAAKEYTRVY